MPIVVLTLDRRYNGQQCISNYAYLANGTPASVTYAFAAVSAFGAVPDNLLYPADGVFQTLRNVQNDQVFYQSIVARTLYNDTDFYELPFPANLAGVVASTSGAMASYEAYGVTSNRVRQSIDRGHKRYEGVIEAGVDAFGKLASGTLNVLALHAAALSEVLTYNDEGNSISFSPAVRQLRKVVQAPPKKPKYVEWETEAEALAHLATGVVYKEDAFTTTQNTRKVGRGS